MDTAPTAEEPLAQTQQALSAGRVVAYVDGTTGLINAGALDATKYTHINYAFANLDPNGNVYFTYPSQDDPNINALKALKANNPNLKILISVGGWTWSNHFSAVTADPAKRANLVNSAWNLVTSRNVDGIDIDWEWPGWQGEGDNGVCAGTCDGERLRVLMQDLWNSRPAGKPEHGRQRQPWRREQLRRFPQYHDVRLPRRLGTRLGPPREHLRWHDQRG